MNEMIEQATGKWIKKAYVQRLNIRTLGSSSNVITYEDFCVNPELLLEKLDKKLIS